MKSIKTTVQLVKLARLLVEVTYVAEPSIIHHPYILAITHYLLRLGYAKLLGCVVVLLRDPRGGLSTQRVKVDCSLEIFGVSIPLCRRSA